jgi:hypothetical protein
LSFFKIFKLTYFCGKVLILHYIIVLICDKVIV